MSHKSIIRLSVRLILFFSLIATGQVVAKENIRIGILHSLSGTMAANEAPMVDAAMLAVEEINQEGGLLGRRLEAIVVDGESDDQTFARQAEQLITDNGVAAIFGCWTSSSRKAVVPVIEKHDHLLIYPMQYEGFEQSPNVIYTGLTANQQIIPGISWAARHLGKRMYLVGSDYVFPRYSNIIIKQVAELLDVDIVGEAYLPLGSRDVNHVVEEILQSGADIVVNTINGDTNDAFFSRLAQLGSERPGIPAVFSFSLDEHNASRLSTENVISYTAWSYYQGMDIPENNVFIKRFRKRYGEHQTITDPMVTAYVGIKLWSQAVRESGAFLPLEVNHKLVWQSLTTPMGLVSVSKRNRHLFRELRIARHNDKGQVEVLWHSQAPIKPDPYPLRLKKAEWDKLLGLEVTQ